VFSAWFWLSDIIWGVFVLRVKGFWRSFFGVWMSVDFCGFVLSHTKNGGVEGVDKKKNPSKEIFSLLSWHDQFHHFLWCSEDIIFSILQSAQRTTKEPIFITTRACWHC